MTLPIDPNWLHKFTKRDSKWLSSPFMFKIPGIGRSQNEVWTGASDGKIFIAIEGVTHFDEVDEEHKDIVAQIIVSGPPDKEKLPARRLSLPQFSAWCGAPDWTPPSLCDSCAGKRQTSCEKCKGTGKGLPVACSDCGENHVCRCTHCDRGLVTCEPCEGIGTKAVGIPLRLGRIGRVIINREYIARAFQFLSGGTKESRVANLFAGEESKASIVECGPISQPDRILICGPEWKIALVGLRTPDEKDIPVYEYTKIPITKEEEAEENDIPF